MCHVFRCDTPARHIANTLRDICKKIMLERHIEQNAVVQRLSRPTDLPNLEKSNGQANGQKMSFQSLYNSKWQSFILSMRVNQNSWWNISLPSMYCQFQCFCGPERKG